MSKNLGVHTCIWTMVHGAAGGTKDSPSRRRLRLILLEFQAVYWIADFSSLRFTSECNLFRLVIDYKFRLVINGKPCLTNCETNHDHFRHTWYKIVRLVSLEHPTSTGSSRFHQWWIIHGSIRLRGLDEL